MFTAGSLPGAFVFTGQIDNWHIDIFLIFFLRAARVGKEAGSSGDEGLQLAGHLLEVSCRTSDEFFLGPDDNFISQ